MANQQFDERTPIYTAVSWQTDKGTGRWTLLTGVNAGSRIDFLTVSNFDSIDHTALIGTEVGGAMAPFAVVTLPAAVAGKPSITEVISTAFATQQALIILTGWDLEMQLLEAVTDDATPVQIALLGGTL